MSNKKNLFYQKPKIGLIGYFGWGNFGDELFNDVTISQLGNNYDLSIVHDILKAPYFSQKKLKMLNSYDGFLIGGGDLLNPSLASDLYWRLDYLKKPVFIHGISAQLSNNKIYKATKHYRKFFQSPNLKFISTRDKASRDFINEHYSDKKIHLYSDRVFAINLSTSKRTSVIKTLGVCLRNHRHTRSSLINIRALINKAKLMDYKIKFIVLGIGDIGASDYKLTRAFAESGEEIVYSENLEEICREIGTVSQLVSMKYHGLVVATMLGIPSLQLTGYDKNINLLREIQREELAADYENINLHKSIAYYPTEIHSLVRKKLKKSAKQGFIDLKFCMDKFLL